ncbi:MAG: response regulator transcription factor [Chloroflexia bacterium]|nr:response regulator transcription factor [Chloroflexia bacterium]
MRGIIIEDEFHNSQMLEAQIKELRPEWQVEATLDKVSSSIQWLRNNSHPDIIFMDIQLIDGICFSIFEEVKIECPIVFTTAYDEYAIKAFEVNSVDYLLKPIDEIKLEKAIEKFEKIFPHHDSLRTQIDYSGLIQAIQQNNKEYRKRFLITGVDSFYKINVDEIAYINTDNGVSQAIMFSGKSHILNHSLEKMEEELDPKMFYRANRKTILNIEAVNKIENFFGGKLTVKLVSPFKETITISRLKASAFKKWFDE